MKLSYSIAAAWLVACTPGMASAQAGEPPSAKQEVAYADASASTPEGRIQDAAPNFKDCRDWAGLVKEERPKQIRTFELCSKGGSPDSVLNTNGIARAGSLVERDGSLFLEPTPGPVGASDGETLLAGPMPPGTIVGNTHPTIDLPIDYESPVDYGAPPFSGSPEVAVPGGFGAPSYASTTPGGSAPSGGAAGGTTTAATGGGTTTVATGGDTTIVTGGPVPGVPPSTGTGGTSSPGGDVSGPTGGHANNGFGNGGHDGVPGRSHHTDVNR